MSVDLDALASPSARVAVIGGGKMGEAILGGWIKAQSGAAAPWSAACFTVVEPNDERREYLEAEYGVRCVADAAEAVTRAMESKKPEDVEKRVRVFAVYL